MRKTAVIVTVLLLTGCNDPAATIDEAMVDMATELGTLTADVQFTELHVRDDTVCGYADGQRFYSMVTGGSRLSTLVDQKMPEPAAGLLQRSFARCMNTGEEVDHRKG